MPRKKQARKQKPASVEAQLQESGLTQRQFAEREGVPLSTLTYWLRRERLERQSREEPTLVAVAELPISPPSSFVVVHGGLRIEVPRDASVEEWARLRQAWIS